MVSLNLVLTLLGVVYGIILIAAFFTSNRLTELLRLDGLFMSKPSEATRSVNLVAGLAIAGYNIYSLVV